MSANNKPDERFTDFSFADLIAFRQETIRYGAGRALLQLVADANAGRISKP